MSDLAATVLAAAALVTFIGWLLRPVPRGVDPMADKHRHLPGQPCYPCIARLERECGIGDVSATIAAGRDAMRAEVDVILSHPPEALTDAQVERLEAIADAFDAAGYGEPEQPPPGIVLDW